MPKLIAEWLKEVPKKNPFRFSTVEPETVGFTALVTFAGKVLSDSARQVLDNLPEIATTGALIYVAAQPTAGQSLAQGAWNLLGRRTLSVVAALVPFLFIHNIDPETNSPETNSGAFFSSFET